MIYFFKTNFNIVFEQVLVFFNNWWWVGDLNVIDKFGLVGVIEIYRKAKFRAISPERGNVAKRQRGARRAWKYCFFQTSLLCNDPSVSLRSTAPLSGALWDTAKLKLRNTKQFHKPQFFGTIEITIVGSIHESTVKTELFRYWISVHDFDIFRRGTYYVPLNSAQIGGQMISAPTTLLEFIL